MDISKAVIGMSLSEDEIAQLRTSLSQLPADFPVKDLPSLNILYLPHPQPSYDLYTKLQKHI